jgi:hypothetical protein
MKRFLLLTAVMIGVMAGQAKASPVTYYIRATATGSLGGTAFTDRTLTITTTADTDNVIESFGHFAVAAAAPTLDVTGFSTATFLDTFHVAVSHYSSSAGMYSDSIGFDLIDTKNSAFSTYQLTTPIGPVSGTPVFNPGASFSTDLGDLVIDAVSVSSFQATGGIAAAPEPSTIVSAAIGGLMCLGYARRRRAA